MYEFCYDCLKNIEKSKSFCMNSDSFIVYIKQKTFTQTIQKIFKQNLVVQIKN